MKQKLTKALHRHAEQELMKVFPEAELKVFEPVSDTFIGNLLRDLPLEEARKRAREIETLPESCLCWVLNPKSQLKFYVVLLVAPKDDSFTFEIGWNKQGRLPRSRGRGPGEEGDATECSIRIGRFWGAQTYEDWWYLGGRRTPPDIVAGVPDDPLPVKLADVQPKLADALEKVKKHAVPYLRTIAERYGAKLVAA